MRGQGLVCGTSSSRNSPSAVVPVDPILGDGPVPGGNPSGRPKGAKAMAELIRKETGDMEQVVRFFLDIMRAGEVPRVRGLIHDGPGGRSLRTGNFSSLRREAERRLFAGLRFDERFLTQPA